MKIKKTPLILMAICSIIVATSALAESSENQIKWQEERTAPAAAAKVAADKLEVARQAAEAENQRLKIQEHHSFLLPTSEVKVFDSITMGLMTLKDVDKIASKSRYSTSLCSIYKTCQFQNIDTQEWGGLGDVFYSQRSGSLPLTFAKFEMDGKYFEAAFYEGLLVELRVGNSISSVEMDASLVKELRPAFNKKYKKLTTISRKEKTNYKSYNHTYERWAEPSGAFEVQIKDTRKILIIPEHICMSSVNIAKSAGVNTADSEWECKKVTDNVPVYHLSYRYPAGFNKASSDLAAYEREQELKSKNETAKKVGAF